MFGHIWWILTLLFGLVIVIMGFEGYIWIAVIATMLLIGHVIAYCYKFARKPMIRTKGKVKSKVEWTPDNGPNSYRANILLSSKKVIILELSKEQYDGIRENTIVDLIYQGHICAYIKGSADQPSIINTDYYPANIDVSKLMKLNAQKANKRANKVKRKQ